MQENAQFQNFNNANNFDPNSLANQTSTAICFVVVTDVSPSISSYVDSMNTASRDVFMQELKNCHRKDDILIKNIEFCERVSHKSGFLPIVNLNDDYLDVNPQGGGTALYQAVNEALEHAIAYRKDLENQGIEVRTCIFIITDGEDNSSSMKATDEVKAHVEEIRRNEAWTSSFTINMLGVGNPSSFRQSCLDMGLNPDKCLSVIGASAHEIRQQMGVISQSVSSSTAAASVNF
jgi:uncharacterized protein YegL